MAPEKDFKQVMADEFKRGRDEGMKSMEGVLKEGNALLSDVRTLLLGAPRATGKATAKAIGSHLKGSLA